MKNSSDVEAHKEEDRKNLEAIVLKKFPQKALEMHALIDNDLLRLDFDVFDELNISKTPPKTDIDDKGLIVGQPCLEKCGVQSDGIDSAVIGRNRHMVDRINLIKPLLDEFLDDVDKVWIGINLMIPHIEDGNNFGVGVQEDVIAGFNSSYKEIKERLIEIHQYYISRADLLTRVAKHPCLEDWRHAVREKDQMFYRSIHTTVVMLRNNYLLLHDLVEKNLDKVKKPKSAFKNDMY